MARLVDRPPATELREAQRFMAAIVESAEDAIFAKTLDGRILTWNNGAQRMYGYAPEDIVGDTVYRLVPPERHAEIDGFLAQLRRGEPIRHYETERVRRSGERFPVSLAISPVRGADGEIIGASTVARDITEQRRLIERVAFQRSLLAALTEASIDGVLAVDPEGQVIFSNRRFADLWAIPPDVLASDRDDALIAHVVSSVADQEAFVRRIRYLYDHPTERSRDQIQLRDGRVIDRFSAAMLGDGGHSFGRVWYFRDVTSENVREAQLQAIVSAIPDAAIVCEPDGRIVARNPAADRLLPGLKRYEDVIAALGEAGKDDRSGAASAPRADEYTVAVDGTRRRVRVSTYPVPVQGASGVDLGEAGVVAEPAGGEWSRPSLGTIVLLRDVSELRDAEASREAFVGVLSHELRTPITTIYGAAKILQRSSRAADRRRELLGDIEDESDRLYRLVEDLLVLTRIERESLELADEPVLVGPIVRRVVVSAQARSPLPKIEASVPATVPMARGEETYVEQILRNLLGNAIKYGPPEGTVKVVVEAKGEAVLLRVLDEGPGVSRQEAERVFDLLYRSPSTAAQAAGSGIGLFVSRRLAEAMGGRVSAKPRRGRGAEFVLELPVYRESEAEAGIDRAGR